MLPQSFIPFDFLGHIFGSHFACQICKQSYGKKLEGAALQIPTQVRKIFLDSLHIGLGERHLRVVSIADSENRILGQVTASVGLD